MRNVLMILCVLFATTVGAAESAEPLATIHAFVDSFDKGDVKGAEATHATDVSIIDEFPPYHWRGRGAFKSWVADLVKYNTASGVTDANLELGNPLRQEVSGARAYLVLASEYSFKQKGVTLREPSQMTFALTKDRHGWRIVGWTFTGPKPAP